MLKRRGRKRTRTFWTTLRRRSRSPGSVRRNPPRTGPAPPPRRRPPAPPSPPTRRDRIRSRETFRDGDFSFFFLEDWGKLTVALAAAAKMRRKGRSASCARAWRSRAYASAASRATRAAGTCSPPSPPPHTTPRAKAKNPASSHGIPNQPNPLPS